MCKASKNEEKRKHLRYTVDPAYNPRVAFEPLGLEPKWRPALIADESYSGCRIITIGSEELEVGDLVQIDHGDAIAAQAEVVRSRHIDPGVLSVGCTFI